MLVRLNLNLLRYEMTKFGIEVLRQKIDMKPEEKVKIKME